RHLGGTLAPSGPIIVNDTLVVGSQDSNVYLSPLDEIIFADSSTSQGIPWLPGITILLAAITIVLVAALVVQGRRLLRRSDARALHGRLRVGSTTQARRVPRVGRHGHRIAGVPWRIEARGKWLSPNARRAA